MIKKLLICFVIAVSVMACKKEASNPVFVDMPVIQAYLRVGDTARLNVSRLIPYTSNAQYSSDNINALQIFISANNTSYQLQPQGNGNYIASNPLLKITLGTTYSLSLVYNGKNVSASTVIPSKPTGYTESINSIDLPQITTTTGFGGVQAPPVTLNWINSDGSYYLIVVENIETNPILINTLETDGPPRTFKNSPIQTNTFQLRSRQFHYFGWHRIILYHINPDYANLYGSSNNSSTSLSNSSTSVTNGAGIFTGLNADTLLFNVVKQ